MCQRGRGAGVVAGASRRRLSPCSPPSPSSPAPLSALSSRTHTHSKTQAAAVSSQPRKHEHERHRHRAATSAPLAPLYTYFSRAASSLSSRQPSPRPSPSRSKSQPWTAAPPGRASLSCARRAAASLREWRDSTSPACGARVQRTLRGPLLLPLFCLARPMHANASARPSPSSRQPRMRPATRARPPMRRQRGNGI